MGEEQSRTAAEGPAPGGADRPPAARGEPAWGMRALLMTAINLIAVLVFASQLPVADAAYPVLMMSFVTLLALQVGFALMGARAALQRGDKLAAVGSGFMGLVGMLEGLASLLFVALTGAAWGRPLRIRGRLRHPELRAGSDWSRGQHPDTTGLDAATLAALEALWLHDAQKEHASVPAFSRISWMLAAVGAPPRLMEGAHRAAIEEVDHACRCFALAAGYGGRAHTVLPMPDLLLAGLESKGPALEVLAEESLKDGCLLEDFNSDVAGACAAACRDPVTREVLARIAREERSHAEFSWELLAWTLSHGGAPVTRAVNRAIQALQAVPRPSATSRATAPLVARADAAKLAEHGRITDPEWAVLWSRRLAATVERARRLCVADEATSGAAPSRSASSEPGHRAPAPRHAD
jgi:hypothetical protein